MIGIIAIGEELILTQLDKHSIYSCAGELVSNFIEKYEIRNTRISKIRFKFGYQRVGKVKPRRTFYKLKGKGIVIQDININNNNVYKHFITNDQEYISIGVDADINLPIDIVFHLARPDHKIFDLFIDNVEDRNIVQGYKTTVDRKNFSNCKFALVSSYENYVKALAYGCYPLVWSTINRLGKVGFDKEARYINFGDLNTRIVTKESLIDKLNLNDERMNRQILKLKVTLREELRSLADIQAEVDNKLFNFLRSK